MRAYYSKNLSGFLSEDAGSILGALYAASGPGLTQEQKDAWEEEIRILKEDLCRLSSGRVFLEFTIPRMGKRADAILYSSGVVFVIEFKVGATEYLKADIEQCVDYALDMKNFHEGSHFLPVVPILVATGAQPCINSYEQYGDGVFEPVFVRAGGLGQAISDIIASHNDADAAGIEAWEKSGYRPTPTIIEAAQALYDNHDVADITRAEAGAENLTRTTDAVIGIINESRKRGRKSICFVTGVPGAGKTLAGLNLAVKRRSGAGGDNAVFLSGNGPLIQVLQEALARNRVDNNKRKRKSNPGTERVTKADALRQTRAFIQNINNFLIEAENNRSTQYERIVIFDEAQRAWDRSATDKLMKKKVGRELHMSEPEFLISAMDRHEDWAVIVCLVGGGQEINHNEAGLPEWFSAVRTRYPEWDVYLSDEIRGGRQEGKNNEYLQGSDIYAMLKGVRWHPRQELHLATSIRSFRSAHVSRFVKALLDLDSKEAMQTLSGLDRYPIVLTRNFDLAKRWLRERARGGERFGIVAAAKSYRLKPYGIYVEVTINAPHWFLNPTDDPRSSCGLEYTATEFEIQGLELDWACVAWDADLRYVGDDWQYREFRGDKWTRIAKEYRMRYLKNAYRVLLTRARQGMVIFVPEGDPDDSTRNVRFYDGTYCYLKETGIQELEGRGPERACQKAAGAVGG